MNTKAPQSPLFTDLKQEETSTVQGGYFGCPSRRRYYRVVPVHCFNPCPTSCGSGSSVVQTVNVTIDD